ncbi:helix-turn-helix transcriptional regulator [Pseudomonas umsongensis]|jgi:LuxR family maltose regulon positive regulatory protein|uniref:Helix-turn-helix transcriptional regulator n=1 Tax=Pseudomonas umsongensis TaxID=198618 RepID=A0ABX4E1H3_9PSED|nr:LuxR C-terminal-related transcriptional regulator [Pseudomonas umsongensis]MBT9571145.1 helix-turn-helix transcriptional regulator [Pseudomonas umsongensis]OXR35071.1 helix-turn-helix transcriptional regulator [Pseudomonas umsongensis]SDT21238.1 LuxR family transcriptional regulator, maltose regulon positive regulatory protein [Pseudomonas umsongensis]
MHTDKLLVSTKFAPPRIGTQTILRERLLEDLRGMTQCRVGLVTGSPGFGKTTLLAQWRQVMMRSGAEVAWLALSADDKHVPIFFAYLRGALQRLGIVMDSGVPLEGARPEFIDEVVATIVEGAASINKELFLVIDDYQHVSDPRSHQLMQKLLDHSPENLHFVISSRVGPPLSFSRLRLSGQLLELDCATLPFDLAESRAFLEQSLAALKLSPEEFHQIHELTSGWPATLQLVIILLRSDPQSRGALREMGWRSDDLQSYLAEDVMAHLPPELAQFMESVSICRRFNASLAQAITGVNSAQAMLKRLDEENLLIFRVEADDRQPWYRFHALFGDFLATRLARRDSAALIELHNRAAHWFAERKLLAEAVRHATLAGDLDFAAQLIERAAPATWSLSQLSPLLRLLDRLPQDILFSRPRLFFLGCLAYALTARPAKAEIWLEQFHRSGAAQHADVAYRLPLVQAAIEVQRDRTEPIIGLLEDFQALPDDYSVTRFGAPALLTIAYLAAGRIEEALQCLDDNPIPEAERNGEMALVAEGARTLCYLQAGQMREAERIGSAQLARAVSVHGHRAASAYLGAATLAEVYREVDRTDEAREILANRNGLLQWAMPDTMLRATICRARLDLLQDSAAVAMAFLERQERHFRTINQDRALAHCLAEQARIALLENDKTLAADRVAKLQVLADKHRDSPGFQADIPAIAALAQARLLLATNYPDKALAALAILGTYATKFSRGQLQVTGQLLEACAKSDLLQPEQAQARLLEAVSLGRRLGLVRTFLDEGEVLRKMLVALSSKPLASEDEIYLRALLERFGPGNVGRSSESSANGASSMLTPRELAILELISQAMANKRVALTLNISLETVKWNLKNIYAKLGVSSRYDAVSWARKNGLIE